MKKKIAFLVAVMFLLPISFTGPGDFFSSLGIAVHTWPSNFPGESMHGLSISTILEGSAKNLDEMGTLTIRPLAEKPRGLYQVLELKLETNLQAKNPYDPNDVELRVAFSSPSGKEVEVGAFWYQDFNPESQEPSGRPFWMARFTPDEVGEWLAVAYAPASGLHSDPIRFSVEPSNKAGFIRVNPSNPHYLAFDNGDFYFPIGVNMAWWDNDTDPIGRYHTWLDQFTANGGNTIRVWMASWSFGIEWRDTGLGNYDKRQYEAWALDQLFKLADEHGVKIILVLINHGALSLGANSEWKNNPYNARLGGPLTSPEQFVSDPLAKTYFRQRLNYIINRWGYSPELLAWEWINEANLTPISDNALASWLKEMTAFLDEHDVYRHLTTSSFAMRSKSVVWRLSGLDIIQTHEYSSQINESQHDLGDRAAQDYQELEAGTPDKPILMGEFGYSAIDYGDDIEKTGIHLHNGLWATTFSGYAGTGMYWWWDTYIDAHQLWGQFKGLANFIQGEDLTEYQTVAGLQINDGKGDNGQVTGLGLKGETILVWLRSNAYTTQAAISALDGKPGSTRYEPPEIENQTLTLRGTAKGAYTVRWFDPQKAEWLETQTVTSGNHTLIIPIPAFRDDIAAKIIRTP